MRSLGAAVRRRLGRFETPAANLFRAAFLDLPELAQLVRRLGDPERILEIGCGDGALSEQLARVFPFAELLGIDIAAEPGRLFRGDRGRVRFRSIPAARLLDEDPDRRFDLVIICDVLHHVPRDRRDQFLLDARRLTSSGGLLVVKEWERRCNLAHALAYLSDRYLTGDRVAYSTAAELTAKLRLLLPADDELVLATRTPPRRNNILLAFRTS